jgi:hypothetical protein
VITSIEPKIDPTIVKTSTSTWSPGTRMAEPPACSSAPAGGGSVARWTNRAALPATVSASETSSPAWGETPVARAVTSTGPTTKMTSSMADSSE